MDNIFKSWITIECPKCNYPIDITFSSPKLQEKVYCHNCKTTIQLVDDSASVHTSIRKIDQALKDLGNLFK